MAKAALGYTALDIARWFINATDRQSGDDITHLKVQKLIYYAQGWSFAKFDRPLFEEDLEAWAHGPVARTVFNRFKRVGFSSLPEQSGAKKIPGDHGRLLEAVHDRYGIFSAKRLERMTHNEAPWKNARGDLPREAKCDNVITKKDMKEYFVGLNSKRAA